MVAIAECVEMEIESIVMAERAKIKTVCALHKIELIKGTSIRRGLKSAFDFSYILFAAQSGKHYTHTP